MDRKKTNYWMLATIVFGIGFVIAGFAAIKFSNMSTEFYAREMAVRLSPLDLERAIPKLKTTKGERIVVFLGDSRAEKWPLPNSKAAFYNLGVSGQTTSQILGRLPYELPKLNPEIVVVQAGVNDLKAIAVLPNRRVEIIKNTKMNLDEIVRICKTYGAKVIVTTIFPSGAVSLVDKFRWNESATEAIIEVNFYLKTKYPDCLDSASILSRDGKQVAPGLSIDLLHINENGYNLLNQELEKRLIISDQAHKLKVSAK